MSKKCQFGFTLMELLIAVSLSALIITSMAIVFDAVVNSARRTKISVDLELEGRILSGILYDDINSVMTIEGDEDSEFQNQGDGEISAGLSFMEFVTTNSIYQCENPPCLELNKVSYSLEEGDSEEGEDLIFVRRELPHFGITGDWAETETTLTRHLSRFEVTYSGESEEESQENSYDSILFEFSLVKDDKAVDFTIEVPFAQ